MKLDKDTVFFCVIHDHKAANKHGMATLKLCSKALDEISRGKKMTYVFGYGILLRSSNKVRDVQITHLYFNNSSLSYKVGTSIGLHKFWLDVGRIARIKLLRTINPSRRNLFKGD